MRGRKVVWKEVEVTLTSEEGWKEGGTGRMEGRKEGKEEEKCELMIMLHCISKYSDFRPGLVQNTVFSD